MRFGQNGVDFEPGINYEKLRQDRLAKAKTSMTKEGLGALICYDFDNIRYITGTHIGEWCRNKMNRYCILAEGQEPHLFDPASAAKKTWATPWMEDRVHPAVGSMRGAIPPEVGKVKEVASEIAGYLKEFCVIDKPVGMDIVDIPLIRALEEEGIEVVDGQEALINARIIKTYEEIELLKTAAGMVDAAYEIIARAIKPGIKENELVAIANKVLYDMGSELVECVNSISGKRGQPHSHTFSNRFIRPGEFIYLDIMHSYNGYRTCYYRTFICGQPNKEQIKAYETCYKWLYDAINQVKPGNTTRDVASVWPSAQEMGFESEEEAFLLQFGHGIGMSIWEKPVISRLFSLEHPFELKEGMVFALETWCPSADKSGAARIEEEVVVTNQGCEIITKYPCNELISCGLPGCLVY